MSSHSAILLDGTALARDIVADATVRAADLTAHSGITPCLATVLVGDDPASAAYVRMKQKSCASAGIDSRHIGLRASTTTAELLHTLAELSADPAVHGILLQHPVGPHIDERAAFDTIAPAKDVDGVTSASFAAMSLGLPGFASCTPGGIMQLLDHYRIPIAGRHAVVVGRSPILGKPIGMLLLARDATVTFCHSHTRELADIVRGADIVVAAVGKPEFIPGHWIKPGAAVVDAGYNPGNIGDVDFTGAASAASHLTPVPGGVGPMTVATLLSQTVTAAARSVQP